MKRVLNITATNGGTTAKVRIEIRCLKAGIFLNKPQLADHVAHQIADGVMEALRNATHFQALLSRQRVGR